MHFGWVLIAALAAEWIMTTKTDAGDGTVVRLGTATPGGGFPVYGDALVAAIRTTDPGLDIQPPTKL